MTINYLASMRKYKRDALLKRVYHDILIPSFRTDELDSFEETSSAFAKLPRTKDIWVALNERDPVGVVIGDWYAESEVYLLSYLAVHQEFRSQHVGGELMKKIRESWTARGAQLVLAEVDDPRHYNTADPGTGDPERRLVFYGREGGRVLDLAYFQPRLSTGGDRVRGMFLIALHVDPDKETSGKDRTLWLQRGALSSFLQEYFNDAEGADGDDVERADLFARAAAGVGIRLLPVERYTEAGL